ncbi:MAG TPA: hypothetical protein VKZ51_06920 [Cyclobacteriaceae bacterium]|nr:hypothetical protein [Cyclobacteriaceae bacterium]
MVRKCFYFFVFIVVFFAVEVQAQQFLMLQKGANEKSRLIYEQGDDIVYRQKGRDYFISDRIVELHPDFLVLTENILRPEEIAAVYVGDKDERNLTLGNLSTLFLAGGALLFVAETINGLYQDGHLSYSRGGLITGGSLLAGGFILSRVKYRYFKNKGRNKIQIIYLGEK